MNKKQKNWLKRILLALSLFFTVMALDELGVLAGIFGEPGALYASFALYLIPYLIAGHDVLLKAWRNIRRGEAFDGSFLMAVATIGAIAMIFFPETESRILELVENASEKKARTENFITRFARVYTPIVTLAAVAIAVVPPLEGMGAGAGWILRGLTFLVVSCPCALVISVPL